MMENVGRKLSVNLQTRPWFDRKLKVFSRKSEEINKSGFYNTFIWNIIYEGWKKKHLVTAQELSWRG